MPNYTHNQEITEDVFTPLVSTYRVVLSIRQATLGAEKQVFSCSTLPQVQVLSPWYRRTKEDMKG